MLRGFHAGHECLESWVHDEDPTASLLSMFESGRAFGRPSLTVLVGASRSRLDLSRLSEEAGRLGRLAVSEGGEGLQLRVDFGDPTSAGTRRPVATRPTERRSEAASSVVTLRSFQDLYGAALAAWAGRSAHRGRLDHPRADGRVLSVTFEGACVTVELDPNGLVVRARHEGGDAVTGALLEAFCTGSEGVPLREVLDHSARRVELEMRARRLGRTVPGIQHPAAVGGPFRVLDGLIRGLRDARAALPDRLSTDNRWTPLPKAPWADLTDSDRLARARAALARLSTETETPAEGVVVRRIERTSRVIVAFDPPVSASEQRIRLLRLEPGLKDLVDPTLTLYLEEATDRNKLRRL